MKVTHILKKSISLVTPKMHAKRRNALTALLRSLVNGSAATVTSMGRGLDSRAKEKHNIKRADRLLSNTNLHRETLGIYKALCQFTVGQNQRPIILIDWSDLDEYKRHFLIRASLASHGRGLCIYEEVHGLKTKEKAATHKAFLANLSTLLPDGCRPIIVTDAGFKTPWFRAVLNLGWDFVGRARLPNFYESGDGEWQCITNLYKQATSRPKLLSGHLNRSNPFPCQLVLYKGRSKGRQALNRSGQPQQSKRAKAYTKSARDPWLLATSLPVTSQLASRIVKIYRMRMQIEEGFRDMKSRRFGLGFEYNKTTKTARLSILILLTTLTHWLLMILGSVA
ncbi:IS4 family transposase, partial [Thalassotalea mangrovi]